ncbi:biotin/lipoyl-binding protein [Candidatus Woesearchaeota archaeon]|nr:biotin/lipoyl-binding protein [Candidatus Woesearchaeota archaeon]
MEELKVDIDGKEHLVKIEEEGDRLRIYLNGQSYEVETALKKEQEDYDFEKSKRDAKTGEIRANIPGIIFSIDVKEGQDVKKGQKLVSLLAMKMENQILSPAKGKVKEIKVKKNDKVNKGDLLLIIG